MTRIKFRGFPNSRVAMEIAGIDVATDWPVETAPAEEAVFVVQDDFVNGDLPAFGANIVKYSHNGGHWPHGFAPGSQCNMWLARAGSGGNVVISTGDEMLRWRFFAPEMLVDGEADVYRIIDGVFTKIRTSAIVAAQGNDWYSVTGGKRFVAGSSAVVRFDSGWKWGQDYWIGVRAVDPETGNYGPVAVAQGVFTTPDPIKIYNGATSPLVDLELTEIEDASVETPTGVILTPAPNGESAVTVSCDPLTSALGLSVFVSDVDPVNHAPFGITLANDGPPVQAGDLIVTRKKANRYKRSWNSTKNWTNVEKFVPPTLRDPTLGFPDDDPARRTWEIVETPGADHGDGRLQIWLAANEVWKASGRYATSEGGNDYWDSVEPGRTIRAEVKARASAAATLTLTHGIAQFGEILDGATWIAGGGRDFPLSSDWTDCVLEFRITQADPGNDSYDLTIAIAAGASSVEIDLASLRIFYADTPYAALDEATKAIVGQVEHLRDTTTAKSLNGGYSLDEWTNRPGNINYYWGGAETLPAILAVCEDVGTRPWLLPDLFFPPEWHVGLVEYLAAPYDPAVDTPEAKPWAAKRHTQGRTTPWSAAFDRIYLEIGLEVWNNGFAPFATPPMTDASSSVEYSPGEVYGLWTESMIATMKSSPYWPALEAKMRFVLSGQATQPGFIDGAIARAPSAHFATGAPYLGGWESHSGPFQQRSVDYCNALFYGVAGMAEYGDHITREARAANMGSGTYESGPGYSLADMTDAESDAEQRVGKSKAMAVAMLDSYLALAERGATLQSWFAIHPGAGWASHGTQRMGGVEYPTWKLLKLWNRVGPGEMLRCFVSRTPTETAGGETMGPGVGLYATRNGARLTLAVINRNPPYAALDPTDPLYNAADDGARTVRIQTRPRDAATDGLRHALDGAWTDHSWDSADPGFRDFTIVETPVTLPADGALVVTIPPAEARIYTF
jgi:hypothetical protein